MKSFSIHLNFKAKKYCITSIILVPPSLIVLQRASEALATGYRLDGYRDKRILKAVLFVYFDVLNFFGASGIFFFL